MGELMFAVWRKGYKINKAKESHPELEFLTDDEFSREFKVMIEGYYKGVKYE